MLEFHKKHQQNPDKTEPEKRIKDFQEIYRQFDQIHQLNNHRDVLNVVFLFVRSTAL